MQYAIAWLHAWQQQPTAIIAHHVCTLMHCLWSAMLNHHCAAPLPAGLVYFDVENNSLTGPLPDFTQAADLVLLDVSGNQLTQALPESLGAAGYNLQYFDLGGNRLSGNINAGDVWDRLPGLRYCMLNDNGFEGKTLWLGVSTCMNASAVFQGKHSVPG
eukprot:GHRR01026024.1.p1 GENE.GHRR01026024.1~~GHRR01026024.1.p1  ORF type:complete len:159 (-),score=46.92 GHRR01026024.1:876-1352(-)